MAVYVDELESYPDAACSRRCRQDWWCHMWADTPEELHSLASQIGLRGEWFQGFGRLPHYDLTPSRRAEAVKLGAVETSIREWLRGQRG